MYEFIRGHDSTVRQLHTDNQLYWQVFARKLSRLENFYSLAHILALLCFSNLGTMTCNGRNDHSLIVLFICRFLVILPTG